ITSVWIRLTLAPCDFPGMSNRLPCSSQRLHTKAKAARIVLTSSRGATPPLIRSEIPREGRVALRKVRPGLDLDVRSETKFHATWSCVGGRPTAHVGFASARQPVPLGRWPGAGAVRAAATDASSLPVGK